MIVGCERRNVKQSIESCDQRMHDDCINSRVLLRARTQHISQRRIWPIDSIIFNETYYGATWLTDSEALVIVMWRRAPKIAHVLARINVIPSGQACEN